MLKYVGKCKYWNIFWQFLTFDTFKPNFQIQGVSINMGDNCLCSMGDYIILSQLKNFTPKTTSPRILKMWSTIFLTFKIDGIIRKFVQIPVY